MKKREPDDSERDLARVLDEAASGDRHAAAELLPQVYRELRALALARLAQLPPGQTLQATALVHEAYLHLVGSHDPGWRHRAHFFGAAAQAMRQILVDRARRKGALKRGGKRQRVDFDAIQPAIAPPCEDILAINEALERLESLDAQKADVFKLRYFAGLTLEETAMALGKQNSRLCREWKFIRAWMRGQLGLDERHVPE